MSFKNNIFFSSFLLLSFVTFAQPKIDFGLKGGVNYNANGDYFESVTSNFESPDRNIGYHFGLFGKIGKSLYFRPEIVYTRTKSDYNSGSFDMSKIDVPLLIGLEIINRVSVFAGPSLQYIVDSDFNGVSVDNFENEFTVGANFGIALDLNKFGIDLRYERGLTDNEANIVLNNTTLTTNRIDARPDQLILSLSYKFL